MPRSRWLPSSLPAFMVAIAVAMACGCSDNADSASALENDDVLFSHLRVEGIEATRAIVRFTTSVATTCEVEYGTSVDTLAHSATDPSMSEDNPYSLEHEVVLEDLNPATTYFFRARATTPEGDTSRSDVREFSTSAAIASTLTNVALSSLGTTIIGRSSNFGGASDDATWGALNAIDGRMSTEWATQGDGDNAYLELDLGVEQVIVAVALRSRQMADGTSIIERLEISGGGETRGPFDTPDPGVRYEFLFDTALNAREFRFDALVTTGGNTGLRELELLVEAPSVNP